MMKLIADSPSVIKLHLSGLCKRMKIHAVTSYTEGSIPSTYTSLYMPLVQAVQMQIHIYSRALRDTLVHKPTAQTAHKPLSLHSTSQDSVVSIVTSYRLDGPGFISQQG